MRIVICSAQVSILIGSSIGVLTSLVLVTRVAITRVITSSSLELEITRGRLRKSLVRLVVVNSRISTNTVSIQVE
jgi:hypothetical protein